MATIQRTPENLVSYQIYLELAMDAAQNLLDADFRRQKLSELCFEAYEARIVLKQCKKCDSCSRCKQHKNCLCKPW